MLFEEFEGEGVVCLATSTKKKRCGEEKQDLRQQEAKESGWLTRTRTTISKRKEEEKKTVCSALCYFLSMDGDVLLLLAFVFQ